jgi:hypothetical protein
MKVCSCLSAALVLLAPFVNFAAAPANDNFINPTTITGTNATVTGTNIGATKEVGEPNISGNPGGKSVWWKWTAPAVGSVIIQTTGSSFDTMLAAYSGSSIASLSDTLMDSNDDNGDVKTSLIGFNVTAGATYYITVDGYLGATGAASGTIILNLLYRTVPLQRPPNDDFANRIQLRGPVVNTTGASFLASKEPGEPDHADELGGKSVWWSWTAPASGNVSMSTDGSDFDTLLAVYTGSALLSLVPIASNDDVITNVIPTSLVQFPAISNTVYQIAVDGYDGEPGDIQLHISMPNVVWLDNLQPVASSSNLVNLTGVAGKQYSILVSTNLVNWRPLTTIAVPGTNAVPFMDGPTTSTPRRFYSAQQLLTP